MTLHSYEHCIVCRSIEMSSSSWLSIWSMFLRFLRSCRFHDYYCDDLHWAVSAVLTYLLYFHVTAHFLSCCHTQCATRCELYSKHLSFPFTQTGRRAGTHSRTHVSTHVHGRPMFRPKTVSAHCAETSVSAIGMVVLTWAASSVPATCAGELQGPSHPSWCWDIYSTCVLYIMLVLFLHRYSRSCVSFHCVL